MKPSRHCCVSIVTHNRLRLQHLNCSAPAASICITLGNAPLAHGSVVVAHEAQTLSVDYRVYLAHIYSMTARRHIGHRYDFE